MSEETNARKNRDLKRLASCAICVSRIRSRSSSFEILLDEIELCLLDGAAGVSITFLEWLDVL